MQNRTVAVGIIRRDGLVLLGQRRPDRTFPLTWEFPGGKVEAGESIPDALARELNEELGIKILDATEFYRCQSPVEQNTTLVFHLVTAFIGEPKTLDHAGLRWMAPIHIVDEYDTLPFINGETDALNRLFEYYAEDCNCERTPCACAIAKGHMEDCKFRSAATCVINAECEHGNAVCSSCDRCTCP